MLFVVGVLLLANAAATDDLQKFVSAAATKYNVSMSFSAAAANMSVSRAAGAVDGVKTVATTADPYAWGSVTKTITGAAIMRLAADGRLSLDESASKYVDPVLKAANYPYPSMEELFRADKWSIPPAVEFNASNVTIRMLLAMMSGVPDYDTDAYRFLQYNHPHTDMSPFDILSIVHGPLMFRPGGPIPSVGHRHSSANYCSVNFVLLGLILMQFSGVSAWADYDQSAILPPDLRNEIRFANRGTCAQYTAPVHGYDKASFHASTSKPYDVSDTSCVGGWSAGNVIGPASSLAKWVHALYGTESVLPASAVREMVPGPTQDFYGLATFNFTGRYANGTAGVAWGHLGDTYGFTSVVAFFPNVPNLGSLSIAVATNGELQHQDAPHSLVCVTYNWLVDYYGGRKMPRTCSYDTGTYYFGDCRCEP